MKDLNIKLMIKLALFAWILSVAAPADAQTTSFTYQGRLSDTSLAANGTYEMQFVLFDAVSGGSQIGSTQTMPTVSIVNGIFTVELDFGLGAFSGPDRFLEIAVRRPGDPNPHTLLTPRQPVTSAPYAVRSLNADNAATATNSLQLDGIDANQYVQTNDPRMTDTRDPNAGSSNYIQNRTNQQPLANFNISGNGTIAGTLSANHIVSVNSITGTTINAGLQYNIGGNRAFAINGTDNTFAGVNTGTVNTSGAGNSFFGRSAGQSNTTGNFNTFIGKSAGVLNSSGDDNTFVGRNAGTSNTVGNSNTLIGSGANVLWNDLTHATAIGADAIVGFSNIVQLGRLTGEDRAYVPGKLIVENLAEAASIPLCTNSNHVVSLCDGSFTATTKIGSFSSGLDVVNRLSPITFKRKNGETTDLGLDARDVVKIEPLLVTNNAKGEAESVRYDRIGVILLNAVKEQQAQIQKQQLLIERMQKILCRTNDQAADLCKEDK